MPATRCRRRARAPRDRARLPSPPHARSALWPRVSVTSTPAARRSAYASASFRASAAGPSSSSSPSARSFGSPSRASVRPESTSCEPCGTWGRSATRASRQSWFSSSCTSSSTSTRGSRREASAAPRRGRPLAHSESPAPLSPLNTAGPTVPSTFNASAMYVRRTAGSLSRWSRETQANWRASRAAHWARAVVLP